MISFYLGLRQIEMEMPEICGRPPANFRALFIHLYKPHINILFAPCGQSQALQENLIQL
jgi:hypothetical protein